MKVRSEGQAVQNLIEKRRGISVMAGNSFDRIQFCLFTSSTAVSLGPVHHSNG